MQEMTTETAITLIAILTPLNIYLWHHLGSFQLHSKPKTKPEGIIPDG
ncbi:putative phage membrane protein [Streptococcus suis]|uniref:Putative phage membrane protein n=1 Tax=Streptococcus suis TaxID=1307 RepID=A0A116QU99_STRSU|nr:putative phage membrane protein [Streptococcus suis]